ncbi:MAG: hypothetical protein KDK70_20360 [Myxococcales bacterium]|nr:hypothetical protein [Myxococcales bacterium]
MDTRLVLVSGSIVVVGVVPTEVVSSLVPGSVVVVGVRVVVAVVVVGPTDVDVPESSELPSPSSVRTGSVGHAINERGRQAARRSR